MEKTFINWIVRYWWVFPLATVLLLVALMFVGGESTVWGLVLAGITALVLFLQLPVFIILLLRKEWWRAVGAFLAGIACLVLEAVIGFMFFSMFLAGVFSMVPDDFGKEHPIPQGMVYNKPLGCVTENGDTLEWQSNLAGTTRIEPVIDSTDSDSWLQIWYGFQGGIYEYSLYWPALADGEVYLRCFEATENIELSKDRLKSRTTRKVTGHNGFGLVVDKGEFTIYEGDWEDYYAVRVEVWHKPTKGKARKLMEKVYRMEGWMR